jgi:stringent starvation protein B
LISTRPYLLRAIHEWACDSGLTPQLLINIYEEGVEIPMEYANNGQIVLNIHPRSVHNLELGNEYVLFAGRFGGRSVNITLPLASIEAIYAKENGQGIAFQAEEPPVTPSPGNGKLAATEQKQSKDKGLKKSKSSKKTHLKVIK